MGLVLFGSFQSFDMARARMYSCVCVCGVYLVYYDLMNTDHIRKTVYYVVMSLCLRTHHSRKPNALSR